MKLTFLGAARTVTGSCYLLETPQGRLVVDCGMYQGPQHLREQGWPEAYLDPHQVDWLLLTHAHIDHAGNVPLLVRQGYRGPVYATAATADLCGIMLADSARIQEEDARLDLRKWARRGRVGPPPAPLYTEADAAAAVGLLRPVQYDEIVEITPGLRVRWRDAGHIIGAASLEVWVREGKQETKIVFSGDIGHPKRPLLRDPEYLSDADYVVMESTYGNRRHRPRAAKTDRLRELVEEAARQRGHIIIPAFAVGRTQELLYELNTLVESNQVPRLPVYVDSPLAVAATEIYDRHRDCLDEETQALLARGDHPLDFPGLTLTRSVGESMALNTHKGAMIVISASGMCTGGRIRHHLKNHLEHDRDVILFVGYQAGGTLGRLLVDGHKTVKLFNDWLNVRARIESLPGFSAHADVDGLLEWLGHIKGVQGVFVTHGEEQAALDYAALVTQRLGLATAVPEFGDRVDLSDPASRREAFALSDSLLLREVEIKEE